MGMLDKVAQRLFEPAVKRLERYLLSVATGNAFPTYRRERVVTSHKVKADDRYPYPGFESRNARICDPAPPLGEGHNNWRLVGIHVLPSTLAGANGEMTLFCAWERDLRVEQL